MAIAGALALAGCGAGGSTTPQARPAAAPTPVKRQPAARPVRLHVSRAGTLPAPVMDPATAGGVFAGGLNSADVSVATEVALTPTPRSIGSLPAAWHDAAAGRLGSHTYLFGGGNIGSSAAIYRLGRSPAAVGRLPRAASDVAAATVGHTAYIVGGYDGAAPLDTILAWRPGQSTARVVGHLRQPLRYAAVAASGGRLIIAGGTVGVSATRDVLSFDPVTRKVSRIGQLSTTLTHAAAAALHGRVYVFGGRGANEGTQRRAILAIDPATGRVRHAGSLPAARSDMGATTVGGAVLLVGGRDRAGTVHDQVWSAR